MARLAYTATETEVRNEARLRHFAIYRYLDNDGQPILDGDGAEQLVVEAVALVGNFDGTTWIVHDTVVLPPVPRKLTTVVTFFGTVTLGQMEQKVLQFMQNEGLLPAGTIT